MLSPQRSEEALHLGNVVYQLILFSQLEAGINEIYPALQTDYDINGTDSFFYVNQKRLQSLNEFFEIIEEEKKSS